MERNTLGSRKAASICMKEGNTEAHRSLLGTPDNKVHHNCHCLEEDFCTNTISPHCKKWAHIWHAQCRNQKLVLFTFGDRKETTRWLWKSPHKKKSRKTNVFPVFAGDALLQKRTCCAPLPHKEKCGLHTDKALCNHPMSAIDPIARMPVQCTEKRKSAVQANSQTTRALNRTSMTKEISCLLKTCTQNKVFQHNWDTTWRPHVFILCFLQAKCNKTRGCENNAVVSSAVLACWTEHAMLKSCSFTARSILHFRFDYGILQALTDLATIKNNEKMGGWCVCISVYI